VGIDKYDAPVSKAVFDSSSPANSDTQSIKVAAIESFFRGSLFSILKEACDYGYTGCISSVDEPTHRDYNDIRKLKISWNLRIDK